MFRLFSLFCFFFNHIFCLSPFSICLTSHTFFFFFCLSTKSPKSYSPLNLGSSDIISSQTGNGDIYCEKSNPLLSSVEQSVAMATVYIKLVVIQTRYKLASNSLNSLRFQSKASILETSNCRASN